MRAQDFQFFERALAEYSGVRLRCFSAGVRKRFFQSCVRRRLDALRLSDFGAYREHLGSLPYAHGEWSSLADAFRANRTSFFRSPAQFRFLEEELLSDFGQDRVFRAWCAGCASGEEAATLAIVLSQGLGGSSYEIQATDLNREVIEWARFGHYRARQVSREVPRAQHRFFSDPFASGAPGVSFRRLNPDLAQRIRFDRLNLVRDAYPAGPFDLILCRNVLYYFEPREAQLVLRKLRFRARVGGHLFVSRADGVDPTAVGWTHVRGGTIFRRDR